ncbi:MAG: hypothetical protein I3274_01560 [Candidatus Moeniiplasma glomeromycotorum]|nr:hypothetical protein [Candidatus Moeniiplasma glomeromycotorum]
MEKRKNDIFLSFFTYTWFTLFIIVNFLIGRVKQYKSPEDWYDWLHISIAIVYLLLWVIFTFTTFCSWLRLQNVLRKIAQIDQEIAEELTKL